MLLGSALRLREPNPLETLTMRPWPDFLSSGRKALVTRNTPNTLVSKVCWKASTVNSEAGIQSSAMPALFTRMSRRPWRRSNFGRGFLDARLRSDVDWNEFDAQALGSKIGRSLLSALRVAGTHQDENAFGGELPGDFLPDSFVCAGDECNFFAHSARYDSTPRTGDSIGK